MNDNPITMSEFEAALQDSFEVDDVQVGDIVKGTIAAIHGDVALIDINGKSEAVLDRSELDEQGTGEPIEVVVVSVGDEVRVSYRQVLEQRLKDELTSAVASGLPLEGKVVGRRKGGFDVTIGGVRGFCPMSQIDESRSEEVDHHLGQTYRFRVLEYDAEERKLVVSRAALQRAERDQLRAQAWDKLEVGATVEGKVRSITDFGAFVDLGGVDGLVHVTEISHARVNHPKDALSLGQVVAVVILDVDRAKNRISLSMKQLEKNPWSEVAERFPARAAFTGTVVRKAPFGVFVTLAPGLDGLLHVSQLPPGVELAAAELAEGQTITGWVRDIDVDHQRISLTQRRLPDRDPWERIDMRYQEGQVVEGTVENGADFGVFVELEPGLSALIPASELSNDRNVDPRTMFTPGDRVTVKVLSVDGTRQRISLSVKAFERDKERAEYVDHMSTRGGPSQPTMTGFGAQLMNAIGKKK